MSYDEVMRITEKLSNFLSNEIAAMTRDERIFTPRDIENAVYQGIRAAYEAGKIAMREKVARFAETHWTVRVSHAMPEVPANFEVREEFVPQTSLIPLADAIRALAISGAEESKKEKP